VIAQDAVEVVFRTTAGAVVRTPIERVAGIRPASGLLREGRFFLDDPNSTRLFFAPTGRALRRGEAYAGVHELLMPIVQVGITNRISIGGGTPLLFGIPASERPYWITPKAQIFSGGRASVALGVVHAFGLDDDDGAVGVAYAVATRELSAGSVTVGGGLGYTSHGDRGLLLMAGGDRPAGRNARLITENYFWRTGGVASLGVRFFGEKLSADVAIAMILTSDLVQPTPIINFMYRF
jgi:hypothetical protein